ncbi:AAA family ATPase [Clostridium frigidicarnis]|uniref:PD-(D/E)XK nuclease superfamily protein n=1 Tax=Clostridium frigidicarnis TaxID=84698 RepID=A0A1I0XHF3_9CLOT|nr:AAA family ATPase [Clostridium frigidicarnis]SFA99730.1 PD-(D/E)XK nuclease superfamily protein [Clostridium frigidicarnis]
MNFKPLPIGVDNFKDLIINNYYYVDKTLLIKDIIDNKAKVNLFTRPRRFGKTLNISMIKHFFEANKEDNSYLFKDLKIMAEGDKYTSQMGQYPVINLSLKSAKQPTFELAYECLLNEIIDEFKRHDYVLNSDKLSYEKDAYINIINKKENKGKVVTSIKFLSQCLEKYHNKKVIILIDEYDVPLENSFFRGFYDEMIDFIRSLFESALKTNDYLEFAVLTGCLRISKESIFTGLNNLDIISILNKYYDEYFGFKPEEVNNMLKDYNLEGKEDIVKEWYNGYIFGDAEVYNPWSVVKYVKDLYIDKDAFPISYWANTSSNSIVKSLIEKADDDTKAEIEELIAGKIIEKPIHEDITYGDIDTSMDNLWNFLFFTGYLKKAWVKMNEDNEIVVGLTIPNEEIRIIYKNTILNWFDTNVKSRDLTKMYDAMLTGDTEAFENELVELLTESISFYDAYENFYHGFLLGTLVNIKRYIIKSNRESGKGRSDIVIRYPNRRGAAVILELKVAKNIRELEKKCDEALKQIEDKEYDKPLLEEGYTNILKYGITFYKKDCMIKSK